MEEYWTGYIHGLVNTERHSTTKEFLRARNIPFAEEHDFFDNINFQRGCFESSGNFFVDSMNEPHIHCAKLNLNMTGNIAMDYLQKIYESSCRDDSSTTNDPVFFELFKKICLNQGNYSFSSSSDVNIGYKILNDAAILPRKRVSEIGYEIQVVKKIRAKGKCVVYDTGLHLKAPFQYYFELIPCPDFFDKTKYSFEKRVFVEEAPLTISMMRANTSKDLKLPQIVGILIVKKKQHLFLKKIDDGE